MNSNAETEPPSNGTNHLKFTYTIVGTETKADISLAILETKNKNNISKWAELYRDACKRCDWPEKTQSNVLEALLDEDFRQIVKKYK